MKDKIVTIIDYVCATVSCYVISLFYRNTNL